MGKPCNDEFGLDSVTSIHPSYQNTNRLAYYRRKLLVDMKLVPDKLGGGVGEKSIMDMFGWAA